VNDIEKYCPGRGPVGAKLMIVGEAPFDVEIQTKIPFSGPSGRELDRLLKDSGINRSNCWISNVCKYYVPPSPIRKGKPIPFQVRARQVGIDLDEQILHLQTEINEIQPNCILALGGTALWALTGKTGIGNYRGSILRGMGRKTVPSYHPAHLLHQAGGEFKGYWNRQVMIHDFKRAYEESLTSEYNIPRRVLSVCRNSAQLYDFIERNRNYGRPAVDIEALNCIPTCIGLAYTPNEGISVPLWNSHGISSIPDSDLASIWAILVEVLFNDIIGQNFKYDQDKIRRLGFRIRRLVSDTMLKAFVINPELPKNLAFNTSIYTREPYYKDEGSEFDISKQSIDDLFIYNARDACVTKEIDLAMDADLDELGLRPFYENFIMHLHELYLDIESEGFVVDEVRRSELLKKYVKMDEKLRYELFQLAGFPVNVNSKKDVPLLLWEHFKLPRRDTCGEDDLTALLQNVTGGARKPEHRRAIEVILEDRRVRKTIGTYLMALPDFDGKMRTTYYLCLETGRTSTGQLDPPIRPKIEVIDENGDKAKKNIGTAFQTITKHGEYGDVRGMYIAEPGHIFLQADKAQAEARVVFLLANDEQALQEIDSCDYHARTASWFFGGTEETYSKKLLGYEHPIRFAGKTLRHAGHLGAAKRRASIEVNTQARKYKINLPYPITEGIAGKALEIFHQRQPKIRQVFQAGVIACLEKDRMLTAPLPYGIDAPCGGKRTFYERWGEEMFRQAFSYLPQRAISDSTKADALRIRARAPWIRIILEAHDGLLFTFPEYRLQEAAPIVKEEMEQPINFDSCSLPRRNLVIPCELETGYNYQELSKFRYLVKEEILEEEEEYVPKSVTDAFTVN
jgi:uracil-DNA glycosylase family 4